MKITPGGEQELIVQGHGQRLENTLDLCRGTLPK